jgi:hypothetical protein
MGIRTLVAMAILLQIPALAAEKVTVTQLENVVALCQGKADKDAARKIDTLTLSERISRERYKKLDAELPGQRSRAALLVLADAAAFLDLPASDLPVVAPPSIDKQRKIVISAVNFASETTHKMPDFFATRDTTQFQSTRPARKIMVLPAPTRTVGRTELERTEPFRQVGESRVTVHYRDGKEVVEKQPGKEVSPEFGVTSRGEFGELLPSATSDLAQSKIAWSHWEQGETGLLAVFQFDVPKDKAHYQWTYCCGLASDGKPQPVSEREAYHGEIAINPKTGVVFRLKVKTEPSEPILEASEVVEFGPVELGGRTYILPVRNIVLYTARRYDAKMPVDLSESEDQASPDSLGSGLHFEFLRPVSTAINHTEFENYHLFRADVRIVPGEPEEIPDTKPAPNLKPDSQAQP